MDFWHKISRLILYIPCVSPGIGHYSCLQTKIRVLGIFIAVEGVDISRSSNHEFISKPFNYFVLSCIYEV